LQEAEANKYAILCDRENHALEWSQFSMTRVKKIRVCSLGGAGVGGKWMFWIMYHLLSGTKRFGELQRLIPQASRQMLTLQLRELEQMGMLHRQGSPKVEYALTELGGRSEPMFRQLYAWGKWTSEQIGVEFDWEVGDEPEARICYQPADSESSASSIRFQSL
jgi:DNA-binding HxlR family transcriptional regulator